MNITTLLLLLLASFAIPWLVSFVVEALRPAPKAPETIPWDSNLKPAYVMVDGVKIRYLKTGQGPTLVLLHTLEHSWIFFTKSSLSSVKISRSTPRIIQDMAIPTL